MRCPPIGWCIKSNKIWSLTPDIPVYRGRYTDLWFKLPGIFNVYHRLMSVPVDVCMVSLLPYRWYTSAADYFSANTYPQIYKYIMKIYKLCSAEHLGIPNLQWSKCASFWFGYLRKFSSNIGRRFTWWRWLHDNWQLLHERPFDRIYAFSQYRPLWHNKRKGLPKERRREKYSSSTWNVQVQVTPLRKTHFLEFLGKKESRFIRRRYVGCCQNLLDEGRLAPYAQTKAKRVSTQCKICKKSILPCLFF